MVVCFNYVNCNVKTGRVGSANVIDIIVIFPIHFQNASSVAQHIEL